MRVLIFIAAVIVSFQSFAQNKYLDKRGVIYFEASEKTFEPVKAKNNSVTAILNAKTGEIASLALVKEFRFRNALMQEHFNENYVESDLHPKTTFRGKILNFNVDELTSVGKEYNVIGTLNFHGVDKEIESKLLIAKQESDISLRGNFITTPQDFNIKIPKIVRNKIAKKVKVELNFKLTAQ